MGQRISTQALFTGIKVIMYGNSYCSINVKTKIEREAIPWQALKDQMFIRSKNNF